MRVEVRVFATLRRYLPELGIGEAKIVEVAPDTTFGELSDLLRLPSEEVKICIRNGLHAEAQDLIEDGDRIAFFPPIAGG